MDRLFVVAVAIVVCTTARAGDTAARAETTSVGTGIVFSVASDFDVRLGYSASKWSNDPNTSSMFSKSDAKLRFDAADHPSLGLGGISAKVETGNRAAPYLGLGKGPFAGAGPSFYADAGVMLTGLSTTALSLDCAGLGVGQCLALQNQAMADQTAFRARPALNIGVTFGF
jgi:hypothetical protein